MELKKQGQYGQGIPNEAEAKALGLVTNNDATMGFSLGIIKNAVHQKITHCLAAQERLEEAKGSANRKTIGEAHTAYREAHEQLPILTDIAAAILAYEIEHEEFR